VTPHSMRGNRIVRGISCRRSGNQSLDHAKGVVRPARRGAHRHPTELEDRHAGCLSHQSRKYVTVFAQQSTEIKHSRLTLTVPKDKFLELDVYEGS